MKSVYLKRILRWTLGAVVILTLTACPSKENNRGGPQPPMPPCQPGTPGYPNCGPIPPIPCPTCTQGGGNMLVSSFGRTALNTVGMAVTFATQTPVGQGSPLPQASMYSGPVVAMGSMFVTGNLGGQYCPIPPGQYNLVTTTPGQWTALSFFGLRVDAQGPVRVALSFPNNWVSAAVPPVQGPQGTYPYKLQWEVFIESVNGQPCPYFSPSFVLE